MVESRRFPKYSGIDPKKALIFFIYYIKSARNKKQTAADFFDSDSEIVCFILSFFLWVLCRLLDFGFCCDDSFSILVLDMYLDTYVRWPHHYFRLRYTICFSYCVINSIFCTKYFICFPPEVIFRSCDHGLHQCSDEFMWERQQTADFKLCQKIRL